jgi:Ca2+-binding EF-hand superfamily protein
LQPGELAIKERLVGKTKEKTMTPRNGSRLVFGLVTTFALIQAGRAHAHGGAAGMFQEMDTNGDGKLSPEEHTAGAKKMFAHMDANGDGKVTAAEMTAAHERIAGKPADAKGMSAAEKIKVIDTNGDGILSTEEHAAGAKVMFEKMDSDNDGFLTKAEFTAGHAKLMHKSAQ